MMGRQHAATGLAFGLAACWMFHPSLADGALLVGALTAGSIGPDIDCATAMITRGLSPLWLASRLLPRRWRSIARGRRPLVHRVACGLSGAAYRLTRTARDDEATGTHRYLTHTVPYALAVAMVWTITLASIGPVAGFWWVGPAFGAGHLVHVAGDWLTPDGVPLAWPLARRGKRWWRFRAPRVSLPVLRRYGWRIRVEWLRILPFHAGRAIETRAVAPALWSIVGALAGELAALPGAAVITLAATPICVAVVAVRKRPRNLAVRVAPVTTGRTIETYS